MMSFNDKLTDRGTTEAGTRSLEFVVRMEWTEFRSSRLNCWLKFYLESLGSVSIIEWGLMLRFSNHIADVAVRRKEKEPR